MVFSPKISVVITCFKEGKLLIDAYQSLLNQSDKDFEIVIVNDKSPDELTNSICRELSLKPNTNVIFHEQNGGLAQARKTGYKAMQGDICVPLDADDVLPINAIANIRLAFQQNPDAGFVFGNYWKVDVATGKQVLVNTVAIVGKDRKIDVAKLASNWMLLGTSPCRKDVFEEIGGASQQFSYDIDDMDFWIKVLKKGHIGFHVSSPIYTWNRQISGMNFNLKGEKMLALFETHFDFFKKYNAAEQFQPAIYGPYLKMGDIKGLKSAIDKIEKLGVSIGKYKILKYIPNFLLQNVYNLYRSIKYKT